MTNYVSLLATLPPVRRAWQRLACSSSLSEESLWIINDNGENVIDCKLSKILCKQGDGPDFDNFHIISVFIISTNVCMNVMCPYSMKYMLCIGYTTCISSKESSVVDISLFFNLSKRCYTMI